VPVDVSIVEALDTRLQTAQRRAHPLAITVVWKVTYRVTARWSKRQNLAIAVGERATFRVIAPNLRAAPAALEGQVVVLARNAIAAARSVTLRVRAPRRPEEEVVVVVVVVVQEATTVEATVVLGAGVEAEAGAGAVKKHATLAVE